jgi:hypothetical protein
VRARSGWEATLWLFAGLAVILLGGGMIILIIRAVERQEERDAQAARDQKAAERRAAMGDRADSAGRPSRRSIRPDRTSGYKRIRLAFAGFQAGCEGEASPVEMNVDLSAQLVQATA